MDFESCSQSDKAILTCYAEFMMTQEGIPSTAQIYRLVKYYMDVQCYDLLYPEVQKAMTMELVAETLFRYKNVHKHDGITLFEAQNVLFDNWSYSERLIKGVEDGNKI